MELLKQVIRGYSQIFERYQDVECMNSYHSTKTDIQEKIATLEKKSHGYFCKHCSTIKEIIIRKNRELKRCLADRSKQLKLIDANDDIKNFIDECTKFPECVSKRSTRNNRFPLKSTTTGLCKKNGRCNNGNTRTSGMGSKEQQRLTTKTSERGKTLSSYKSTTEEDNHAISPRSLSRSVQESGSGIRLQQIHTVKGPIPKNSPDAQSDGNIPGQPDTAEEIVVGHVLPGQAAVTETRDSAVPAGENTYFRELYGKDFVQIDLSGANADGLKPASTDIGIVSATRVHIQNTHSGIVITDGGHSDDEVHGEADDHTNTNSTEAAIKNSVTERSADSDTIHYNIHNGGRDHTKISDVNNVGDETRSSENSRIKPPGSAQKNNELTDNKSDIFNKIFDAISNKEHVINASIPIGLVLLLSLLVKCTPLWRVLTKKNRKKGADINEELNRVLPEPSFMDEERRIPISYSAFEYSS
ncbi:hypothetical protein PVNG_05527 [Plasmodium vivax North Korean]|uniref:Variable surface protein Vir18 n=1 Tax=Plasmodium vivax North Korean TaxID=1035514 RepID=A0A0J9WFD2_PLAVI|nr:hypothetical protein PVNG_05527 [Plasmodium vivax North Korean]